MSKLFNTSTEYQNLQWDICKADDRERALLAKQKELRDEKNGLV